MKRSTIDAICKKAGIEPFPDNDPRYSEPLSITFLSHTPRPSAPSDTALTPAAAGFDSSSAQAEESIGIACATPAATIPKWEEIASADQDTVSWELLEWAGLLDIWNGCQERWERADLEWNHDFVSEVAESCSHIFIDQEEWDNEMPGDSGVSYTIETDNPEALRQELRDALACQLRAWRKELGAPDAC